LLRWRLVLGAFFIAALIGLMWLDHHAQPAGIWLLGLALVAGLGGANEVVELLKAGGLRPRAGVIYGGTLLVIASNSIPLLWQVVPESQALERAAWPLLAFMLVVLVAFAGEMLRYLKPGGVIVNVALAIFGVAYIGLLLSFCAQLRLLGGRDAGLVALAALVIVVKMGDTGAYTCGRLFGRHKMTPLLSPGKTWEGAAGGMAFAVLGSWIAFHLLPRAMGFELPQRPGNWLAFGIAVGIAGVIGDLAESLFKRDMGRKDSSTWMPGFGGLLDLLDSILFAAPVAYQVWYFGLTVS
jgi:phosphatidate cytidylyltransferase